MKVKRTERGWAGHFICANRCRFRRNTLLEKGEVRIVVSSVGLMEKWTGDPRQDRNVSGFETIGCGRYYETMVFHAEPAPSRYFDADVSRGVNFSAPWCIAEIDADDKANAQHDAVVAEIEERMAAGEFDNANPSLQGTGHLVDRTLTPLVGRCKVCDGKKWVKYDSNHARPCTACCDHGADGWWELSKYHAGFVDGGDNRCCRGCGELWRDLYPTNPQVSRDGGMEE